MSSKTKSVRFAESDDNAPCDDGIADPAPSDRQLLRMSAKRRPGDQTMVASDERGSRRFNTYDDIGPDRGADDEFPKLHSSSKHTLDSDEEDDNTDAKEAAQLDTDNVEGQEDSTIEFDQDTKITPFNVKEELEEGFYDTDGNFVYKRKEKEIKDAWLDNIDWNSVKTEAGRLWKGEACAGQESSSRSPSPPPLDKVHIYKEILTFLQPKETITKSLRRLGGQKSAQEVRRQSWREKKEAAKVSLKNQDSGTTDDVTQPLATKSPASTSPVAQLTALVDRLVSEAGEYEIYGYTYEKLSYEVERLTTAAGKSSNSGDDGEDIALDIFAERLDDQELLGGVDRKRRKLEAPQEAEKPDEITWEYKWKNEPDDQTHGPFTSEQMSKWAEENFFKDGVFVRRLDQPSSQFYSSKRIDFDLYT